MPKHTNMFNTFNTQKKLNDLKSFIENIHFDDDRPIIFIASETHEDKVSRLFEKIALTTINEKLKPKNPILFLEFDEFRRAFSSVVKSVLGPKAMGDVGWQNLVACAKDKNIKISSIDNAYQNIKLVSMLLLLTLFFSALKFGVSPVKQNYGIVPAMILILGIMGICLAGMLELYKQINTLEIKNNAERNSVMVKNILAKDFDIALLPVGCAHTADLITKLEKTERYNLVHLWFVNLSYNSEDKQNLVNVKRLSRKLQYLKGIPKGIHTFMRHDLSSAPSIFDFRVN